MPILQLMSKASFGYVATCAVDHSPFQLKTESKLRVLSLKNSIFAFATTCTFPVGLSGCSLQLEINKPSTKISHFTFMDEISVQQLKKLNVSREKSQEHILHDLDGNLLTEDGSDSILARNAASIPVKELERRRKIGLANRGRIPWNKGIKHSEETRIRIKKQTIVALSDPKVRKKMSEWPHSHSDQSKAKIGLALRKIWNETSKHKKLQEKLYCSWARYIAEAAKCGGEDQREHGWDSFHIISAELRSQYLQDREERAKTRETAKLRAEKIARNRAEKLAQKRKKKEENTKAAATALSCQNLLNRKKKSALDRESKLIKRLAKHRKKMEIPVTSRRVTSVEPQPSLEKLDLELIKAEKIQRSVSLADQLQKLKSKKEEVCAQLL